MQRCVVPVLVAEEEEGGIQREAAVQAPGERMRVEREPVQIGSDNGWSCGFEVERDDEPGPAGGVQRSRGICQGTDAGIAGGIDEVIGVVGVVLIRLEDGAPCCAAARRREEIDENRVFVDVGSATVWSDAVGGDEPCGGRRGRGGEGALEACLSIPS